MPKLDYLKFIQLISSRYSSKTEFCKALSISRNTLHNWQKNDGNMSEIWMDRLLEHFDVPRHVLDTTVRDIDQDLLRDCILRVEEICIEVGEPNAQVEDKSYWATQMYRQKLGGASAEVFVEEEVKVKLKLISKGD